MFFSSLSTLYSNLHRKQEQLQRLNSIKPKLVNSYNEFVAYSIYCMEPALTSDSWHGKEARSFDDFRELDVKANYNRILTEQFPILLTVLDNEIENLQNDIDNLYNDIAREEAEAREREKNR